MKRFDRPSDTEPLRVIWPFLAVIAALVTLGAMSLGIMTSLRTYIAGESIWSKGAKDAVFYLSQYAESGNLSFYQQYQSALVGPRALRRVRLSLDSREPSLEVAQQSLVDSGIDPKDVPNVIRTFRLFRRSEYLKSAVRLWARGDADLEHLDQLAQAIQMQFAAGKISPEVKEKFQGEIRDINDAVNPMSREFTVILSNFYRTTASLLEKIYLLAAALLILLSTIYVKRFISQRASISEALSHSEARAKATLASLGEAVIVTDQAGNIEFVNAAAEVIFDDMIENCVGKRFSEVFRLTQDGSYVAVDPITWTAESNRLAILQRKDGEDVFVQVVVSRIGPEDSRANAQNGYVVVLRDVTTEKTHMENLAWRATHDALTGLVDRTEFEKCLGSVIDKKIDELGNIETLLFLDLDRFKVVNDTCGHGAGDLMLRKIADLLQSCVSGKDTVGRLGGDEFGVLLHGNDRGNNERMAESIRARLDELVFEYEQESFTISVSVGLLHLASEIQSVVEAMKLADIACYIAKGRGRDRVHIVDPRDSEIINQVNDGSWSRRLKRALEFDQFCLFSQPIADITYGHDARDKPPRTELLLRMFDSSDDTIVAPSAFIPAAERYGLMPAIDRWVVRRALATLAATDEKQYIEYGINLSGASIGDERFLTFIKAEFAKTGVQPALICFEITETTAIANLPAAVAFMNELRGLGCHFALDDFGVGASSFGYLKNLPVEYLKIDGGFVKDMVSDEVDHDMVRAINDMGHTMKCKTIAEYVENEEILRLLEDLGVDHAQGYFIGRPKRWVEEQHFLTKEMV